MAYWCRSRYASSVKGIHQYFILLLSFQCFLTTVSFEESFRFELALWYHARETVITTPCQRWGAHTVGSNPVSDSECKLSFTHAAWKLEKQFSQSGWLKPVRAQSDELPSSNDDISYFSLLLNFLRCLHVFRSTVGSLRNSILERPTSAGSGLIASLGSGLVETLGLIVFIREKKLSNTNLWASRQIRHNYSRHN